MVGVEPGAAIDKAPAPQRVCVYLVADRLGPRILTIGLMNAVQCEGNVEVEPHVSLES